VTSTLPAPPAITATRPRLRRVCFEPGSGGSRPAPPQAPHPVEPVEPVEPVDTGVADRERMDAHAAVARILRLALEVLDGRRPPAQLEAHFGRAALRYWRVKVEQRRPRSPARLGRIHLCLPAPGTAEAAAACFVDGRVRALAARFDRTGGRWRCTAVRLG
jgi:Family of unknown function (DUF6459)